MEEYHHSKPLLIILGIMVCIFSLVTIFKGKLYDKEEIVKIVKLPFTEEKKSKIEWKKPTITREIAQEKPHFEVDRRSLLSSEVSIEKEQGQEVISDDLIITFQPGISPLEVEKLEASYNLFLRSYHPQGIAHFKIPPGHSMSRQEFKNIIPSENPLVIAVESNIVLKTDVLPNEHDKAWLWYLYNDGKNRCTSSTSPCPPPDQVPSTLNFDIFKGKLKDDPSWILWDLQTSCKNDSLQQNMIAVVDGGFDPYHEIKYDLLKAQNITCGNQTIDSHLSSNQTSCYASGGHLQLLKDLSNTTITPEKDRKEAEKTMIHGHHVSGVISAIANNNKNGAGLCSHVDSKVIPILMGQLAKDTNNNNKIIYSMGFADGAQGIEAAASQGAKVINASWGNENRDSCSCSNSNYPSPCHLVNAIDDARSKNVLIVFSAGNNGQDNDIVNRSPTNLSSYFDMVLSVTASSSDEKLWPQSNYGTNSVNLIAPGGLIYVPTYSSTFVNKIPIEYKNNVGGALYFEPDDGKWGNGTSLSAPIVSAIAGIIYNRLIAKFNSTHPLTQYNYAARVKEILMNTADANCSPNQHPTDPSKKATTSGCLNAASALEFTEQLVDSGLKPLTSRITITTCSAGTITPATSSFSSNQNLSSSSEEGVGGGCGFMDTNGSNSPNGNWPILIIITVLLFRLLIFERDKEAEQNDRRRTTVR